MAFQKTVRFNQAAGLAGEIAEDGPLRSQTFRLVANATTPATPIAFGRAFTYATPAYAANPNDLAGTQIAQPGGTGAFAGILINPKAHASRGTASGPLEAVYSVPADTFGELARMAILFAVVEAADAAAGAPGSAIAYKDDGSLVSFAAGGTAPSGSTVIPGARLLTDLGAAPAGGLARIELTTI